MGKTFGDTVMSVCAKRRSVIVRHISHDLTRKYFYIIPEFE